MASSMFSRMSVTRTMKIQNQKPSSRKGMPDARPRLDSDWSTYQPKSPMRTANAVLKLAPKELKWMMSPPKRMLPERAKPTKMAAKTTDQWNMSFAARLSALVTSCSLGLAWNALKNFSMIVTALMASTKCSHMKSWMILLRASLTSVSASGPNFMTVGARVCFATSCSSSSCRHSACMALQQRVQTKTPVQPMRMLSQSTRFQKLM
mmetsp:Transcript_6400/g.19927  ORF Transcript_6400/g.19927 Transcript_6400/m.19927 type:complete len:207 (+) Transcript_6400:2-622(+)